jgi:hypothetical protein
MFDLVVHIVDSYNNKIFTTATITTTIDVQDSSPSSSSVLLNKLKNEDINSVRRQYPRLFSK